MTSPMILSALILGGTLLVFALGKSPIFRVDRAGAAIIGAVLTIGTGVLTFEQAAGALEYRTIVLLFAMMIVTANLKLSGFFHFLGNLLIRAAKTQWRLLLVVILTSGILSALFVNDIVCLLFTPVVILICRRSDLNPLPYLIGLATASNIGSAGSLIGNPQNILIAGLSKMAFMHYAALAMPLAVLGLFINYLIVAWIFRRDLKKRFSPSSAFNGISHPYLIRKSLVVTGCVLAGFLMGADAALVAGLGAGFLLLTRRLKPDKVYAGIDFNLLIIFIGLFVVIGGVEKCGLMGWLMQTVHLDHIGSFPVFALLTVALSNIFSNVPAVMLLKFIIPAGSGTLWWAGMAVFSTLAGNLTLVGSIANLIVVEIAKRDGIKITFWDYFKVGFPLTILMCLIALAYFTVLGT